MSSASVSCCASWWSEGPLVDGVTGQQTVTVDGLAFDDYAEPLRRIGELLEREQWLT